MNTAYQSAVRAEHTHSSEQKSSIRSLATTGRLLALLAVAILCSWTTEATAYDRYKNEATGAGNCSTCHGDFTDGVSPKGSVFPQADKHVMHRSSSAMDAGCDLCHTNGDNRNPFLGSSDGTGNNAGVGCVGCHGREADAGNDSLSPGRGAGLRQHHYNAGITNCADCHIDADPANYSPVGEDVVPQYYGTVDTLADEPCNLVAQGNLNENWTVDSAFIGLDNDGDGLYDGSDPDCSANQPPTADPNGPYSATVGDPVTFDGSGSSDTDGTIVSYDWVFGDGGTGTGVAPTYTYSSAGTFDVMLTVTDDAGSTDSASTTAMISSQPMPPVAMANGPYAGTVGSPVSFSSAGSSDPDGSIVAYNWDFGDGGTSTAANPTYTYSIDGTFNVTLTVTDNDGLTDTDTTSAAIGPATGNMPPVANANGPYTGTEGTPVQFSSAGSVDSDGTIASYTWDFGDGNTSADANPTHTYIAASTYEVTLTVIDDDGAAGSDTTTATIEARQENSPPSADANGPYEGVAGSPVSFDGSGSSDTDGTIVSYMWDFGDGSTGTGATPTHNYASPGTFDVTLTVTDDDGATGTDSTTATITDQQPPMGDGEMLYNSLCAACHGDPWAGPAVDPTLVAGRRVTGARDCSITASIFGNPAATNRGLRKKIPWPDGVPSKLFLQDLSSDEIAKIAEYLNSDTVSGEQRYVTTCAGCHGADASGGFVNKDLRGKRNVNVNQRLMQYLSCLPESDIDQVEDFLGNLSKSNDDGYDDSDSDSDSDDELYDEDDSDSDSDDVDVDYTSGDSVGGTEAGGSTSADSRGEGGAGGTGLFFLCLLGCAVILKRCRKGKAMLNHARIVAALFIAAAASTSVAAPVEVPALVSPVKVVRDVDGIPHIIGNTEHDVVFMQGYLHAQDRFFQMDFSRRQASGTLAELLGAPAMGSDTQLRTIGLRRAAQRSLAAISPEVKAGLQAYADGVNYFLATQPLPPEYVVLEISQADPWTPLDSVAIAKLIAFGLSFDLDIGTTEALISYQVAGGIVGFDGTALFFEDLFRSQPFDPAATVPDALAAAAPSPSPQNRAAKKARQSAPRASKAAADGKPAKPLDPAVGKLIEDVIERARGVPLLENALRSTDKPQGSNEWAVAPSRSASGKAMLANDPHLALNTPATWYQNHLRATPAGLDVVGSTFPGVPYVVLGQNRHITWGATVNPMDVTDTFQEQVVPDPGSPSGLSTVYLGTPEPLIPIPEVFRYNVVGDGVPNNLVTAPAGGTVNGVFIPPVTLIVPRRNNGPIINVDLTTGFALSVQYTGFSPTRELDAFYNFNYAKGMDDFRHALQFFDFGSQNFAYMDTDGNIAYFTSAEMPIREDLQAGVVNGLPPFLLRNGGGGNEWLPVSNPQPHQAVPYEILPFDEMPKLVNPVGGYFINANNDPTGNTRDNNPLNELRPGGGIFYLNPGYAIGTRAGRITQGFEERLASGPLSREDMEEIQADVILLDAQVFTPLILAAFENAQSGAAHPLLAALAADPRVAEAVGRLAAWDYSTPTGVTEGYDASDEDGNRSAPSAAEVDHSIAATIYSVWRGQMIGNTIDQVLDAIGLPRPPSSRSMTALRNLFDKYDTQFGAGASGLNFFNVPGVADPLARRDILVLKSVQDALDLLAGPQFAEAFGGSTEQSDYRWGRLHRIVLDHPLGPPFDTPPAGGAFPPSFPDLPGLAVDGGFGVVDASSHSARADSSNDFMFGSGPSRRYIGESNRAPRGIKGQTTLPGGESGVLGSPLYANILGRWLTNDYYDIRQRNRDVRQSAASAQKFVPPDDDD